jgi:hypothetical protein
MADSYITDAPANGGGSFAPAPEGSARAVCVDGIYLGARLDQFPGRPVKIVDKYAFVFQVDEINPDTNKRYEVSKEFTISMHEKATLRKFLSQWRGKAYTDEEAKGFDLARVVGACGISTITHQTSSAGRVYGKLMSMTPMVRGMAKLEPVGYERAAYWEERKAEYKAEVDAYRAQQATAQQHARAFHAAVADDTPDAAAALDHAMAAADAPLPF